MLPFWYSIKCRMFPPFAHPDRQSSHLLFPSGHTHIHTHLGQAHHKKHGLHYRVATLFFVMAKKLLNLLFLLRVCPDADFWILWFSNRMEVRIFPQLKKKKKKTRMIALTANSWSMPCLGWVITQSETLNLACNSFSIGKFDVGLLLHIPCSIRVNIY